MRTRATAVVAPDPSQESEEDPGRPPAWTQDGDSLSEADDIVPFFDGDDWPGHYGAARLGIP
ncbi:MAG TPA: hypothetical protein VF364_10815 [Candidatus Limnocylindria bacterium]